MNITARIPLPSNRHAVISVPVYAAETDIDDDILEQIEEGKRDDAEIRDFEELAKELGI